MSIIEKGVNLCFNASLDAGSRGVLSVELGKGQFAEAWLGHGPGGGNIPFAGSGEGLSL